MIRIVAIWNASISAAAGFAIIGRARDKVRDENGDKKLKDEEAAFHFAGNVVNFGIKIMINCIKLKFKEKLRDREAKIVFNPIFCSD